MGVQGDRAPDGTDETGVRGPEDRLNELGSEGWRLVETVSYDGGGTKFLIFECLLDEYEDSLSSEQRAAGTELLRR